MNQPIQWNVSFHIGIKVIDDQHQHMVGIINGLYQTLETTIGDIDMKDFFNDAVGYGEYHFQTEEAFFSRYDYPEREQHLAAHHAYKQTLDMLLAEGGDAHEQAEKLLDFLEKWWVGHITGMDQSLNQLVK